MKHGIIPITAALLTLGGCSFPGPEKSWDDVLASMMPYLGHRNWIVVTDMAYPLQSGEGITTLYADEPYTQVLSKVKGMIDEAPHVFAHIYNDREFAYVTEQMAPGIDALRSEMKSICGEDASCCPHEDIIARLDSAGKLYSVVVIKTPLTIPYTTTFFELDCGYWTAGKQAALEKRQGLR